MNRRQLFGRIGAAAAGTVVAAHVAEPVTTPAQTTSVILTLDGRELARLIAPHLPDELLRVARRQVGL